MISVAPTRTTGAVGCELVDTRNSTGKVASERREIHCKPSIKYRIVPEVVVRLSTNILQHFVGNLQARSVITNTLINVEQIVDVSR